MICGCPVITSRSSSIPEVVGDAAILLDTGALSLISDALNKILDDKIRKELINKELARAKLFSWDKVAHKYIEIYKNLISEG
jgi:glycosyltransferase involved in cell wall biosynthesis